MSEPLVTEAAHLQRQIRSFVRREGRATPAQKQAMLDLWPKYGFEPDGQINFPRLFGRMAPVVLEIGFGDGEALVDAAMKMPDQDFIGVEVYTPGMGHCLLRVEQEQLTNVRLCQQDAVELLKHNITDHSLSEIRLFFPDPWPKKKHHKRRIINPEFVQLINNKLTAGGRLHFATDWAPYAEWALNIFEADATLENIIGPRRFMPKPDSRLVTKFERRGLRLGHRSRDLIYTSTKA